MTVKTLPTPARRFVKVPPNFPVLAAECDAMEHVDAERSSMSATLRYGRYSSDIQGLYPEHARELLEVAVQGLMESSPRHRTALKQRLLAND